MIPTCLNRSVAILPTLAALGCALSSALPDTTAEVRKTLSAIYDRSNAALVRKDVNAFAATHTDDYALVDRTGRRTTLAQMKEYLPTILAGARSIRAKTVITDIAVKGATAVVTTTEHAEILTAPRQASGQKPEDVKTSKIVIDVRAKTTWVKTPKGWLQKLSRRLSEKQTVDGKEIQPK